MPFRRWLSLIILAGLLVLLTGCLAPGRQSTLVTAVVNAPSETGVSTPAPTPAPATAAATFTVTQPPAVGLLAPLRRSTVESPEVATTTPAAALPAEPVAGARAPDFTLTDLNGENVSLSDLRGQVVLLNFWTTW